MQAFLDRRPGILERENLVGLNFMSTRVDGADYVKVTNKPGFFYDNAWVLCSKSWTASTFSWVSRPGWTPIVAASLARFFPDHYWPQAAYIIANSSL
jgi:hypothetical protein